MPTLSASRPALNVKLDVERPIRFNWHAACRFEESYGRTIPESMQQTVGARVITYLAWAGMLHKEPSLTLREAERRIQSYLNQDGDIAVLAQELIKALAVSGIMGKIKTEEELEADAQKSGGEQAPVDPPSEE
jgi:hypothetical protein